MASGEDDLPVMTAAAPTEKKKGSNPILLRRAREKEKGKPGRRAPRVGRIVKSSMSGGKGKRRGSPISARTSEKGKEAEESS